MSTSSSSIPRPPDASIELAFGRHAGETLAEVARHDIGYLIWLAREAMDEELRDSARAVLAWARQCRKGRAA